MIIFLPEREREREREKERYERESAAVRGGGRPIQFFDFAIRCNRL
jgi:hypothetical protein